MDTSRATTDQAMRHRIGIAGPRPRFPIEPRQPLTTPRGSHFCSQLLPSRIPCNSLKTKGGAPFYPSQKPEEEEVCALTMPRLDIYGTRLRYGFRSGLHG